MPNQILRLSEVCKRTGLSRSTIYENLKNDPCSFPQPIRLGKRAVGWIEKEVDEWIDNKVIESRG
jgi:prophage regulatory protein